MVLQRNEPIRVWGWAKPSESVTVAFNGTSAKTKADKNGNWKVSLKAMPHGGPYELTVKGKNTITLRNILIGDVWVGSGQSNMEWTIKDTNHAQEEIANANHPQIRLFTVPKALSFDVQKDLAGGQWQECTPGTLGDMTTLREAAKDLPENQRKFSDAIANEKGKIEKWYEPGYTDGWKKITLPKVWEQTEIGDADGVVWFRKEFTVSAEDTGKGAVLHLGPIDDADETYINGKQVGGMNGWNIDRKYTLAANILQPGKNVLTVRVYDGAGGGGIYGAADR